MFVTMQEKHEAERERDNRTCLRHALQANLARGHTYAFPEPAAGPPRLSRAAIVLWLSGTRLFLHKARWKE